MSDDVILNEENFLKVFKKGKIKILYITTVLDSQQLHFHFFKQLVESRALQVKKITTSSGEIS